MNIFKTILEYAGLVLFVILVRLFIITPVVVDGLSMYDTLDDKDVMLLNIVGYHFNGLNRFDIAVIKYDAEDEDIIKRVIGLPGEFIEFKDNKLYVNGKVIKEPFLKEKTDDFSLLDMGYDKVPKDKYFVMGDNRDNSTDSRYIGFIDKKDVKGKTSFRIFPFNHFGFVK